MDTIAWGVIGCGDVVEHKSGPALLQSKGSEILAVMRRDADAARTYTEANDIPTLEPVEQAPRTLNAPELVGEGEETDLSPDGP